MAYISKRTGKEVDELLDKVERGGTGGGGNSDNNYTDADKALVQTIPNKVSQDEFNETVAGLGEAINDVGTVLSKTKANKEGYYPDMSVGMADKVKGVNKVQEELTLTTKPNGNIVIGNLVIDNIAGQSKEFMPATPSGDPMHYMYEAVGAVYNDTGADITMTGKYGNTYLHKSGYWRLNEIGDIPNTEMRKIYETAYHIAGVGYLVGWFSSPFGGRTNVCRCMWSATYSIANGFSNNRIVEIVSLAQGSANAIPKEMNYAFYGCTKLHTIVTTFNMKYAISSTSAFQLCNALSNIQFTNLGVNIFFPDSPLLSKESLLYMINNCASNATFTITLHPDVYAKCQEGGEWYSEVSAALSTALGDKTTTITLASA